MNAQFLIQNEIIIANVASVLRNNWQSQKEKGDVLEVVIRSYKTNRNAEQNKRLHAILQEIANQAWHNGKQYQMEVWKEFFKQHFLSVCELPNGRLFANPTHKLNVKQCAEFMQQIEAYAVSELGIVFNHERKQHE